MSEVKTNKLSSVTTNGNLTLEPNGTGMLVPKRPVAFQVGANDTDQSISANTLTVAQWEFVTLDTGGYWDSSNNRYTPSVAGFYLFGGLLRFSASQGQFVTAFLRKNGTTASSIQLNSGDSSDDILGNSSIPIPTMLVEMNGSSDYVDVGFQHENAATLHDAATIQSVFWGVLMHAT